LVLIKAEILLPLHYSDKTEIEDYKFENTYDKIETKFGGVTVNDVPLIGYWIDPETGIHYDKERSIGCWILCEKNKKNLNNLRILKKDLQSMFDQISILMYYIAVNMV
jgi:hypothetical protein